MRFIDQLKSSFSFKRSSSLYLFFYILVLPIIGLWPFNFWQSNKVSQDSVNSLRLTPPATAYTLNSIKKLSGLREFSILLNLTTDFSGSNGYARILSYSLDDQQVNFMIGQWKDSLVLKLKASGKNLWGRSLLFDYFTCYKLKQSASILRPALCGTTEDK
jgi:hypothetical protein